MNKWNEWIRKNQMNEWNKEMKWINDIIRILYSIVYSILCNRLFSRLYTILHSLLYSILYVRRSYAGMLNVRAKRLRPCWIMQRTCPSSVSPCVSPKSGKTVSHQPRTPNVPPRVPPKSWKNRFSPAVPPLIWKNCFSPIFGVMMVMMVVSHAINKYRASRGQHMTAFLIIWQRTYRKTL